MGKKVWMVLAAGAALAGPVMAQGAADAAQQLADDVKALPQGFFSGWAGNVSLGVTGSDGNTERFNFRASADGVRETDRNKTTFLAWYSYAKDDSATSENKAQALLNNDYLFDDSPWFAFSRAQLEYDEFQAWDTRLSLYGGAGRVLIDDDKTNLLGKVGVGALKEIGSDDTAWRGEGIITFELTHQISERQKLTAVLDIFPDLGDASHVRTRARAVWELAVDPETNMALRIGAEDRYDNDPSGNARKNDVDFFAMLTWAY
ncbi:MAG TPA: DUF481 domain-containing protein [Phycisphaerales bacterium]|nr:DUF481 domain-containing protein [Phycisphaerales bacterium]